MVETLGVNRTKSDTQEYEDKQETVGKSSQPSYNELLMRQATGLSTGCSLYVA